MRRRISPTAMLLCSLLAGLAGTSAIAELRTFLEPRLVDEMDTVRLTIRAQGTSQSEAPDLTPLMDDFEVLGNQTSSRISSINGRTIASVEYQISLRPRKTGELTVPSLQIGTESSEAIRLVVRPLDPQLKQTIANMVFFETELSNNPVYVQAETVLTRRLFYSQGVQIYSDLPGLPEVENAVVIPIGETQSRSIVRGGQRYGVIEQRFALFPEESGDLTIPSISVTSSVRLQSAGRTRRSGIRVSTENVTLEVLPIPAEYPADAAWLPATDVSLNQRWEPSITRIDVGEPLTFKLEVRAVGNRGSAVPPVPLPLPADRFKIYPEAPVMDEAADAATIVGTRQEAYALIPTAPGTINVPPVAITWWDTVANRLRQTQADVSPLAVTGTATPEVREAEAESAARSAGQAPEPARRTPATSAAMLRILLAVLAGLIALLLLGALLRRFGTLLPESAGILSRDRSKPEQRHLLQALGEAAKRGNPADFRRALGAYLAAVQHVPARIALASFSAEPGVAPLLRALDRAIYAPASDGMPNLAALADLAQASARQARPARLSEPLPPLYG